MLAPLLGSGVKITIHVPWHFIQNEAWDIQIYYYIDTTSEYVSHLLSWKRHGGLKVDMMLCSGPLCLDALTSL